MSEIAELNKLCFICLNTETLTPIPKLKYQEVPAQTLLKDSNLIKFENEDISNRSICRKCCKLLYSFHCMRNQFFESQETFRLLLKNEPISKNVQINQTNPNICIDCVCSNVTALNLPTICRICFQKTEIQPIGNLTIAKNSAIKLYEEFSNQKIESNEMLCLTCLNHLLKISKFRNKFESHDFIVENLKTVQTNPNLAPHQTNYSETIEVKFEAVPNELTNEQTQTKTRNKPKRSTTNNKLKHETTNDSLTYKIVCRHCPLTFDTKAEFTRHKTETGTHTFFRTKIECGACKRLIRNRSEYKTHVDSIHRRIQPFECETCLRRFALKECLNRHLLTHSAERRFVCERCGAKFIRLASLEEHIQSRHGDAQCACDACGRVFRTSLLLKAHKRAHAHANGAARESRLPFVCETCGRAYAHKSTLGAHQLTHGERRCVCDVCGRGFYFKRELNRHMLTHTGDMPFLCDVCHKRFTSARSMKEHLRIHTGETPFKCKVCFKLFRTSDTLRKHNIKMHAVKREKV